jgi:hypothetical protein
LFLAEPLTPTTGAGLLIVLASVALVTDAPPRRQPATTATTRSAPADLA